MLYLEYMLVVYGTHVFTKFLGYFGQPEECAQCHKKYKKSMVRVKRWAHLEFIPIFPCGSSYFYSCPICGFGTELKKKDGKAIIEAPSDPHQQNIQIYAKHVAANRPTKKFAVDSSYELWARDLITGEDFCVRNGQTRDNLKSEKKSRGLKDIPVVEC